MGRPTRRERIVRSSRKAVKSLWNAVPIVSAVVLLVGLFQTYVTPAHVSTVFGNHPAVDVLIGTGIGSVSTGNAITSYVLGGELLGEGVSLLAVTAFIVSWVTIGVVQFPAEASVLGRRFALARNLTGIILAIVVSLLTVLILGVFS